MQNLDIDFFTNKLKSELDFNMSKSQITLQEMSESNELLADPSDRATLESDRSFTLHLRDRERKTIKKIREALARINEGTYGICAECGEEIGELRLKARPHATLCVECKSRLEREERLYGHH